MFDREGGKRCFLHSQLGALVYEQLTLRPALHHQIKIVMLLPVVSLAPVDVTLTAIVALLAFN